MKIDTIQTIFESIHIAPGWYNSKTKTKWNQWYISN